jgi:polysaccharide biosynthesis protein PelC
VRCKLNTYIYRIRIRSAIPLLLLAGLLSGGCATRTISSGTRLDLPGPRAGATLAVVPFENLSRNRNAGLILTDLATSVLYAQHRFQIVEISRLAEDDQTKFRRLETAPWERQIGMNTASAVAVGRALPTDWVLAGSVGEYGFIDGFGETANVGITLRLVRVVDHQVLWAASLSRRTACSAFHEDSVHRLAHAVLRDLLDRMVDELNRAEPSGAGPIL